MSNSSKVRPRLPPEQQAIRDKCFHPTGQFVEFPIDDVETSIPARFEKIVRHYSECTAIKNSVKTITYDEFNRRANQIAHAILSRVKHRGRAALIIEDSTDMIAALFAALKAGQAYVPIDPSYPAERITHMLANADPEVVIGNREHISRLRQQLSAQTQTLLEFEDLGVGFSEDNPGLNHGPDEMAYILYTSGSTGNPKGVVQNHRNVLEKVMTATNELHLCPEDKYSLLNSCSTNASVRHIFGALLTGACLCPFAVKQSGAAALARWLCSERVSIYYSFPALFREVCSRFDAADERSIRVVHLAGEAVTRKDVELFKQHFPRESILVNVMGSNETGATCQYLIDHQTQIEGNTVPVGYSNPGRDILLMDDQGEALGYDLIGDIVIKSRFLSPGYWRNPELTKSKYQVSEDDAKERIYYTGDVGRRAPDGCLYYLGRKDFTTKVRGYRISLPEIENALRDIPLIKDVAVVVRNEQPDEQRLIAYLVLSEPGEPSASNLKQLLGKRLPEHMIPARFVCLEALPQTPNGKVDRRALPDPGRSRPRLEIAFAPPVTETEIVLSQMWRELLLLDEIGMDDNFFDLGGNSLLLTKIQSKLVEILGTEIPVVDMFRFPTIGTLAEYLSLGKGRRSGFESIRSRATKQRNSLSRKSPSASKPSSEK
jgi:amino acid adenylation domain-containing protein